MVYYKATMIKMMSYFKKIDIWINKTKERSQQQNYTNSQLTFDRGVRAMQRMWDNLFNKSYFNNCISLYNKSKSTH
jgi:hypothetical protein